MEFSLSALIIGLVIVAVGGLCVIYYQKIADNLAHGVSSYDRVKLFGFIAIGIGLIVMANLHTVILEGLVHLVFPSKN